MSSHSRKPFFHPFIRISAVRKWDGIASGTLLGHYWPLRFGLGLGDLYQLMQVNRLIVWLDGGHFAVPHRG